MWTFDLFYLRYGFQSIYALVDSSFYFPLYSILKYGVVSESLGEKGMDDVDFQIRKGLSAFIITMCETLGDVISEHAP